MKGSLRVPRDRKEEEYITVEIRVIYNSDSLTTETEDKLLNVILTSLVKLISVITKKETKVINQTTFTETVPSFKTETRVTVKSSF
jgi:hypothetical protein